MCNGIYYTIVNYMYMIVSWIVGVDFRGLLAWLVIFSNHFVVNSPESQ